MSYLQTSPENQIVLDKAKEWFKEKIVANHIKNTQALRNPKEFDINTFLATYLSAFLTGKVSKDGIARTLVYARSLSTSITTSFGLNMQNFISDVLQSSYGSVVAGIDIEFEDKIDGRKKYAQLKLGPNTINKDDVTTIDNHFKAIRGLAKQNQRQINLTDLIVGVLYGEEADLSAHYKKLRDDYNYPVFVGNDFWHRLSGDDMFFSKLIHSISEISNEVNSSDIVEQVIKDLSSTEAIKKLAELASSKS